MKILHLITNLDYGGAERMLMELSGALCRDGVETIVVSMRDISGQNREVLRASGIHFETLNMGGVLSAGLEVTRLMSILKRERPDIVQCWMYHANVLGAMLRSLGAKGKLLWNIRCSNTEMKYYTRRVAWIVKCGSLFAKVPDAVIANSESGIRNHERMGYHPRRWFYVPNGIDPEKFAPNPGSGNHRPLWDKGGRNRIIGMVGRVDSMKGYELFLKAASIMKRHREHITYVCVGDGNPSYMARLVEQACRLGVEDDVLWVGVRHDMSEVYNSLDIATSASHSEGFSNTIAEAMACGLPCVVTDVGDSKTLLGDGGIAVPPGDPDALAEGWMHLLDMGTDERSKIGLRGRNRVVDSYSIQNAVSRYKQVYQEVMEH